MEFKRGNGPCGGELSYKSFYLGVVLGVQERVLAAFLLDCR